MARLTRAQMLRMLKSVREDRIEKKQGMSYVPQQEVRAELSRTFGMGNWDSQVIAQELIYEGSRPGDKATTADKTYWIVAYKVGVRLRVRNYEGEPVAEFVEYHIEENAPQPNRGEAHALALTSAASYALRRAAIGLGDSFGLHLYDNGKLDPLVRGTLALTDKESPLYVEPPRRTAEGDGNAAPVQTGQEADNGAQRPASGADNGTSALAEGFNHPEGRK